MALSINDQFSTSPGIKFARSEKTRSAPSFQARESGSAGFREESRASRIDRRGDSVEVSEVAMWFAQLASDTPASRHSDRDNSPIRTGLVESVRRLIESGSYDTTERLDAAADSMIESL